MAKRKRVEIDIRLEDVDMLISLFSERGYDYHTSEGVLLDYYAFEINEKDYNCLKCNGYKIRRYLIIDVIILGSQSSKNVLILTDNEKEYLEFLEKIKG